MITRIYTLLNTIKKSISISEQNPSLCLCHDEREFTANSNCTGLLMTTPTLMSDSSIVKLGQPWTYRLSANQSNYHYVWEAFALLEDVNEHVPYLNPRTANENQHANSNALCNESEYIEPDSMVVKSSTVEYPK